MDRAELTHFLDRMESSFSALEQSIESMIRLVQQEQSKENFYLKRSELLKMVQELQRSHLFLQQHFKDSSARSSLSSIPESAVEDPDSTTSKSEEMPRLVEEICWHLKELTRRNEEKREANKKLMKEKKTLIEQNKRLMDENKALCDMILGCTRKFQARNHRDSRLSRLKSFFLRLRRK